MKILVVDDEMDMQTLFEQRFRREIRSHEMDFAFAHSGEEALGFLKKHVHEAVLILSDINIAFHDGVVSAFMDSSRFTSQERWLEESFRASKNVRKAFKKTTT